jgi:transcriptional regulator with XRE-family HTH domain
MASQYRVPLCDFGFLLERHRKRRRWSLEAFGSRVGHDHSVISRVESGARRPPLHEVDAWADALGLENTERTAFRVEATLAHIPDSVRQEVRDHLMAEGVRRHRAKRRKPPKIPPASPMEFVNDLDGIPP